MFINHYDEILFNGQTYKSSSFPLSSFLHSTQYAKKIIETYKTWRGYNASWKVEDNKFFLLYLESELISMEALFHTSDPLPAEWYSGFLFLEVGLFEALQTEHTLKSKYQYSYALRIENGCITRIDEVIAPLIRENILSGKYFAETMEQLFDNSNIINQYINDLLDYYFARDFHHKILVPPCNFTTANLEFIESIRSGGKVRIHIDDYKRINFYSSSQQIDLDQQNDLMALITKIFSSDFSRLSFQNRLGFNHADVSKSSLLLEPDLDYLEWAILYDSNFVVPPKDLNVTHIYFKLKTFIIEDNLIREVAEKVRFEFANFLKTTNLKKYEMHHECKYDTDLQRLICKFSKGDLILNACPIFSEQYNEVSEVQTLELSDRYDNAQDLNSYSNYSFHDAMQDAFEIPLSPNDDDYK